MRPVWWTSATVLMPNRLLKNGLPGKAVVAYFLPDVDEGAATWRKARTEVEIHLDDGTEPYRVRGVVNSDSKMARFVRPGMTLPIKVKADKTTRLAIDWDAWKASGALDAAKALGDEDDAAAENVAAFEAIATTASSTGSAGTPGAPADLASNPMRPQVLSVLPTMLDSTRNGFMSRGDLDEWLDEQVSFGALSESEAADARASVDEQ